MKRYGSLRGNGRLEAPIKILQGLTTGQLGGTELMVCRLLSRLDRSQFSAEVCLLEGPGPLVGRLNEIRIPFHDLSGIGGAARALWRLRHLLCTRRYHIVHFYGLRMSLLGRLAAQLVRPRPVVVHGIRGLHVTEGEDVSSLKTTFALAIERLGASLVDAYVANSHGAVDFLCSRGLPREKFIIIPNGIDISEWDGSVIRPPRETAEIICVANFRPRKRHRDLVEALALLRKSGVEMQCCLVGDGPTRLEVEALAQTRRLNGIVRFVGSRDPEEVKTLLQRADIFVLPSLWEGLPGSVMEAMAAGLPVVGTNVNGTNELVLDGETGFLVPPLTPEVMAERLAWLAEHVHARVEMGQRGRKRIVEEFAMEVMVKRTEAFYRSLL